MAQLSFFLSEHMCTESSVHFFMGINRGETKKAVAAGVFSVREAELGKRVKKQHNFVKYAKIKSKSAETRSRYNAEETYPKIMDYMCFHIW